MSTTRIFHFAESTLYGPIAQLGERTVRIRKVVGSIPIGSTKMEIAVVKTTAISRLTTEIPQTDFCFNYLTGTPFQECPSFLFVPILFSASQLISLEVAAISQTVAFSA